MSHKVRERAGKGSGLILQQSHTLRPDPFSLNSHGGWGLPNGRRPVNNRTSMATPNRSQMPFARAALGGFIFFSRWLQAPLYVGLIIAQGVYVYHFFVELWHLLHSIHTITETTIMLTVLGLIDVVMIANLLIMVIVGGYETFVSRLNLDGHPDQPEWLSHVNAGVLKVKLATALIGISSIHLLKTFIELGTREVAQNAVMWQVIVHLTFVISALILAWTDRISTKTARESGH
jgi:uncharacterized protein (TIGR00645 family)